MKYRVRDKQFKIRYFGGDEGIIFDSEKEIMEQLASFHDNDYTGVKNDGKDTPYKDIYEFLATLKDDEARLNWLLEYGEWEIEEIGIKCDRCGEYTTKWSGTPKFRICENCFKELQNNGSID